MFNESRSGGLVHDVAFGGEMLQPGCFTHGLCAPRVLLRSDRVAIDTQVEVTSM